jgi:hypothetical protein
MLLLRGRNTYLPNETALNFKFIPDFMCTVGLTSNGCIGDEWATVFPGKGKVVPVLN